MNKPDHFSSLRMVESPCALLDSHFQKANKIVFPLCWYSLINGRWSLRTNVHLEPTQIFQVLTSERSSPRWGFRLSSLPHLQVP
jgi:hypothetical protein